MSCHAARGGATMTSTAYHVPDFGAPTPTERAQGIIAKCEACGKALYRGVEFITTGCMGGRSAR